MQIYDINVTTGRGEQKSMGGVPRQSVAHRKYGQ